VSFGFGGFLPKELSDAMEQMSTDMADVKKHLKELVEIQTEMRDVARRVHAEHVGGLEKRSA
jgi:hypothetical protein